MTLPKTAIKYRTATETDIDFLDRLHTVCLKEHVNRIYSWKPNLFRQTIKINLIQIIVVDDIDVGMIQTEQKEDELYIGNLLILPVFQNRGIGTTVLKDILNQSQQLKLPVKLQVLKQNPAKRLYERLGFVTIKETETHWIMQNLK